MAAGLVGLAVFAWMAGRFFVSLWKWALQFCFFLDELEQKIVKILDEKIRPAVARDGGDIKFKEFKDGVVKVQLQGSCSGCPSSTMTLKQGVQNLLCHYLPEVKEVVAI